MPQGRPDAPPLFESEKDFQQQYVDAAGYLGWRIYHTPDSRRSPPGFPDLILVRGKKMLALEFKMPGRKATPAQMAWLEDLSEVRDVNSYICYPTDWGQMLSWLHGPKLRVPK